MVSHVNFITFNEQTLPLPDNAACYEEMIKEFLNIIVFLSKNYSINKIRMEHKFTELAEFVKGKPLQQILGAMNNQTLKSLLLSFIANKTVKIESPLICDYENEQAEQYINYQYSYNGIVNSGGLACADIWHTACIGFAHNDYDFSHAVLQKKIPDTEKLNDINIAYIRHTKDIETHATFFQQFIQSCKTVGEILTLSIQVNDLFTFTVEFQQDAINQLNEFYVNNIKLLKSLDKILRSVKVTPNTGIGKPELLKHNLAGWSSRRITDGDRLVYKLEAGIIVIKSCFGHYE